MTTNDYFKMNLNSYEGLYPSYSNLINLPNYRKIGIMNIDNYEVFEMKK